MKRRHQFRLVDETGSPFSPHITAALAKLVPRFQRAFPIIRDPAELMNFLEEAARRIAKQEGRSGPIENLHGYAWVTLRSVANSWLGRGSMRLRSNSIAADESEPALTAMTASTGSPEQIERAILWRQVLALLTPEERVVWLRREFGCSSREIARLCGTSPGAVDTLISRAKDKLRNLLGVSTREQRQAGTAGKNTPERPDSASRRKSDFGNFDDE